MSNALLNDSAKALKGLDAQAPRRPSTQTLKPLNAQASRHLDT